MENRSTESLHEQILFVEGMHCSSCELIIEKKLLKRDNIAIVDATLSTGRIVVQKTSPEKLNVDELNQEFAELGYTFSVHQKNQAPRTLWYKNPEGELKLNRNKVPGALRSLAVVAGLLIAFFIVENLELGRYVTIDSSSTIGAFFLLGIIAGVSSCAALVGGLLLSLTKRWHDQTIDEDTGKSKATPHLLFHIGRLGSFFLLGGLLGIVGDLLTFNSDLTYVLLVLVVSIVMVLLALQMLEVSWVKKITPRLPKSITRFAARNQHKNSKLEPLTAGILTFFLPCGFTLIAQSIALASGSFIIGGLIMLYFAFGTLPMLAAISVSGLSFTRKPHLTASFSKVAGILILFFAVYNINGQLNVLGLPSLSDIQLPQATSSASTGTVEIVNGVQQLHVTAEGFNYIPDGPTTLQAGMPAQLVVDNQGILGCGAYMAATGLIDGFVALNAGVNTIDLGTPQPGSYKLTCSMGMVAPVTITVK